MSKAVWFHGDKIEGCENAIILNTGDVLLVKTVKRIDKAYKLLDDNEKWVEIFGTGLVSDQLRSVLKEFNKE